MKLLLTNEDKSSETSGSGGDALAVVAEALTVTTERQCNHCFDKREAAFTKWLFFLKKERKEDENSNSKLLYVAINSSYW